MSHFLQVKLFDVPYGLRSQELKEIWAQADVDGNGVLDSEEFKVYSVSSFFSDFFSLLNLKICMHDASAHTLYAYSNIKHLISYCPYSICLF